MHILLVDDEPEFLSFLKEIFDRNFDGLTSRCAENGAEALHLCLKEKFDLILTDYRMPLIDGAELVEKLKGSDTSNKDTPLIVLSGFVSEAEYRISTSQENVCFMRKPPDVHSLIRLASILMQTVTKGRKSI